MPSYGFPLLGQYYFACMIEIGGSLFVTTLILNFYHRNSRRMPKMLRVLILKWLARVVFPKRNAKDWNMAMDSSNIQASNPAYKRNSTPNGEQGSDDENASLSFIDSISEHDECKISSTYSDPWIPLQRKADFGSPANGISHCKNPYGQGCDMLSGNRPRYARHDRKTSFSNHRKTRRKTSRSPSRNHGCTRHQIPTKQSSSAIASVLLHHFQNTEQKELSPEMMTNKKEWIKAARVLDRLFLIVSILVGISTLLALFLKAPRFH